EAQCKALGALVPEDVLLHACLMGTANVSFQSVPQLLVPDGKRMVCFVAKFALFQAIKLQEMRRNCNTHRQQPPDEEKPGCGHEDLQLSCGGHGAHQATGSSYQPSDGSSLEKRIWGFHATSDSVSTTATRSTGRMLQSLPASTTLVHLEDISTSGAKTIDPPDRTLSPGTPLGAGATVSSADLLLADAGSASTPSHGSQEPRSIPTAGEMMLHSDVSTALNNMTVGTLGSSLSSATSPDPTSISGDTLSSSVAGTHGAGSWQGDLTTHPREPLLASSHPASGRTFAASRSSYMPFSTLATEKRTDFHATGDSMSATATRSTGRTLRSLPASTTLIHPAEIFTSGAKTIDSPDWTLPPGQPLGTGADGTGATASSPGSLLAVSSSAYTDKGATTSTRGGSMPDSSVTSTPSSVVAPSSGNMTTEPVVDTSAGSSAPAPSGTSSLDVVLLLSSVTEPGRQGDVSQSDADLAVGSSHHSLTSSSTEEGISSPHTDPTYGSATLAVGREGTPVTISVLTHSTESSASYTETTNASEPTRLVSVEQSGMTNTSVGSEDLATETLFTHSSKLLTDSSFQNDLTSFPSSHQPVSGTDAEKRTSVSHTDGTYISTIYTRGGERTLLSISNSSTSADSSESSTFFSEISNPSDSSKSPVAQDRKNNVSSDGSFVQPSTEPLMVYSSEPLTSASVGNVQNTTVFDTDSRLLPTDRSSLSSSVSPHSSSVSSLHHSLSSTPTPTYLYTTSESSEPLSSSVMASSTPLQALSSSLPTSSLASPSYSSVSLLPLFSSPSSVSPSGDSGPASTPTATTVSRRVPSTAAVAGSSSRETTKHSGTHQPRNNTSFNMTRSLPLPTEPMEHLGGRVVSISAATLVTETTSPRGATSQRGSSGKATPPPLLITASDAPQTEPTDVPLSTSTSTTSHGVIVPAVALTTVKPIVLTPSSHQPTLSDASTTKTHRAPTPTTTKHFYTTGESTKSVDPTTTMPSKVTKEIIPATSPPVVRPTSKTTVSTPTMTSTKPTTILPSSTTAGMRSKSPATDVDKCLSNPCPALATCNNTRGSYVCQCPLGYEMEKGKCNLVRIFIGQVPLKINITHGKYADLLQVEREILAMLNASLSGLPGYYHSTVKATREANVVHVSVQSTFSLASNVTFYDVVGTVKSYIRACKSPPDPCQFISSLKPLHRVGSLCKQKDPECDKETSECTDFDGVALCQCKSGYFKYNKMDHSCRACEDGYKLENETCVRYAYQLITVVIAAAGGGLLLIMGIALIVTCCRKNKNDISKLIFKSGDFQMSPYAEYPKNPRAQEWGRETIEMQENGSTKNLLQMTDVYYSVSIHSLNLNLLYFIQQRDISLFLEA
ncbi:hypothetical protein CIB84_001463, partial [Bambusicola thoracicus]